MPINVRCECGKDLRVSEAHAGKKGRCPACGRVLTIPLLEQDAGPIDFAPEPPAPRVPAAVAQRQIYSQAPIIGPSLTASSGRGADRLYLVLVLAALPLLIHTFLQRDDTESRLRHTLQVNPQAAQKADQEDATLDDVLGTLPGQRIEGAALGRGTWAHWGFGVLAASAFFVLGLIILRSRDSRAKPLLVVGLFTGTLGILLLLGFQYVASFTQGMWVRGSGFLTVLFYVVKFIGFSYRAAEDPSNGFFLSFLGFTCGVGFCEELCKALPLLWHFRARGTLSWRGACVWGLVSGAGFGVAEGILYSAREYNGICTAGIYWVRFVSCVGLHAAWAAAVGVTLFRNQLRVQGQRSFWELLGWTAYVLVVPMLLHGAYDTLLKQGHDGWAFAAALASFGWLAFQIERAIRQERAGTLAAAES